MAPLPPPPPPPPPSPPPPSSRSTPVHETVPAGPRLPRLEDFPEAGPNALATFQQRGFARVVDELLITLPLIAVASVVVQASSDGSVPPEDLKIPLLLSAGVFAVLIVYEIIGVALWGQTLGKLMFGIRVARYTDGNRPTWAQSALRCLLWAAPGAAGLALLSLSAVGALPIFLTAWRDPLRRALHDEAGGTIVVRTR
jgi:uncharacterized RDD family membrane protein YckC